jgi:hypothetical protein
MRVKILHDQPYKQCILWEFEGLIGIVDYLPYMNDSIQHVMIDTDANYTMLLNMGWSIPIPTRSFAMIARPMIGAPPNLRQIIIAATNPLTRIILHTTLGRESALNQKLLIVPTYRAALGNFEGDRTHR